MVDFDGGTGPEDFSGYGNRFSFNPAPTYSTLNPLTGREGSAVFSPGAGTRVSRSDSPFFNNRDKWTFLAWVRMTSASSSQTIAYSYRTSGTGAPHLWWELLYDATINRIKYRFKDSRSGLVKEIAGPGIQANSWFCVGVVNDYGANLSRVGVRGTGSGSAWEWLSAAGSIFYLPVAGLFRIGWAGTGLDTPGTSGGTWNGQIFGVNVWNRVLAQSEVDWFFLNWKYPWDPDLVPPPEGWNLYATPESPAGFSLSDAGPITIHWDPSGSGQFSTEIIRAGLEKEDFSQIALLPGSDDRFSEKNYVDATGTLENWYSIRQVGFGRPSAWVGPLQADFYAPSVTSFYQNNGDFSLSFEHPGQSSAAWADYYFLEYQINGSGWVVDPDSPWPRTSTSGTVVIAGANSAGGEFWEVRIRARKGNRYTEWATVNLTSDPF